MHEVTIRDILEVKGHDVWSVDPEASVYDALCMMSDKDVGALLVINSNGINGIMSERDYARKVILLGKTSRETRVKEIMSKNVITVTPALTVDEALTLMHRKHIRHLPVMDEDQLIGMISIGDLVKSVIYRQREAIKNLEGMLVASYQH